MELINKTDFLLDSYEYLDKNGIEYALILLRGRFKLEAAPDSHPHDWIMVPDEDQGEWFNEDVHYDDDPNASIRFEKDRVDFKPTTDVIVNGYAYAPGDKPAKSWEAGIQIGERKLSLRIYGKRFWQRNFKNHWELTEPEACEKVALRYENAYGGNSKIHPRHLVNPIGRGLYDKPEKQQAIPAHQIDHVDFPTTQLNQSDFYPVSFGVISRDWNPRCELIGDKKNLVQGNISLPYQSQNLMGNQSANLSLIQPTYLQGNEIIKFRQLLPGRSEQRLQLPSYNISFSSVSHAEETLQGNFKLDTVIFDFIDESAESAKIYLSWRIAHKNPVAIKTLSVVMQGDEHG